MSEEDRTPGELVEELAGIYSEYLSSDPDEGKGFAELLSGWFLPPGHSVSTPGDEQFVAGVARVVKELTAVLTKAPPDVQDGNARAALEIMIRPPVTHSSAQKLYFCAVQEQGAALAPFLKPQNREELRIIMREEENPRRQLPSQRALYKALSSRSGK